MHVVEGMVREKFASYQQKVAQRMNAPIASEKGPPHFVHCDFFHLRRGHNTKEMGQGTQFRVFGKGPQHF